jgi:hypothetical protein
MGVKANKPSVAKPNRKYLFILSGNLGAGLSLHSAAFAVQKKVRCSIFGQVQHQMIIQPVLRYPCLAIGVPREFS